MSLLKKTFCVLLSLLMCGSCFGLLAFAEDGHVCVYEPTPVYATCTEQGYTLFVCSCGNSYKDYYVEPLGHNYDGWDAVQQATCTSEGIMERTCKRCGAKQTETFPVLDHRDSNADGYCDTCGLEMPQEEIFSPFEWLVNLFKTLFERVSAFFSSFKK